MAVNNSIVNAPKKVIPDKPVEYMCNGELVKISPTIVRDYLTNGDGEVTDQEVAMFMNLCRFQHLNPFLKEAYLVKFGRKAASIVIGKESFTKRAYRNPKYKGQQAGVVAQDKETKNLTYRPGALVLANEDLVGGWAKVFVEGYEIPIEATVGFWEYAGRTSDGTLNQQWKTKPATMIRKVALVQALREAFPEDLGSLYTEEEMNVEFEDRPIPPELTDPETEPIPQPEMQEEDYSQIPQDYDQPQIEELPGGF